MSRARRLAKRGGVEPGPLQNGRLRRAASYDLKSVLSLHFGKPAPKGVLYVGVTNDLARRISEHKGKYVPGFTANYGVSRLVYFEEYSSILEARARERSMKRWHRAWKIELIEKLNPEWLDLSQQLAM